MATINSKKLLPPSKSSLSVKNKKILIPASNIRVKKNAKISSEELKEDGKSGISFDSLLGIKSVISKIENVLSKISIFQKKDQNIKRKSKEKEERSKRESKLEKKPSRNNPISGIASSVSNLSFIDRIKKFLFWTLLGRVFSDLLPKLLEFSKRILPVFDFVENFAGNILNGIVDFIDWGYNAYDKVRDLTKEIGGENLQKVFDDFSKHFNTVLNLALIAAMAGSSIGRDGDGGPDGKKPRKPGGKPGSGSGSPYSYDRQRALIRKKYGDSAAKLYDLEKSKGKNSRQALSNIENRYIKKGRIKPNRMTGSLGGTDAGSKLLSRGFKNAPKRLATRALGKAGVKIAGKVFGKIPIIGGLVDFLFALWSGEKPGRAAAKAVGATIGSALGTFIPIPFAGTILGGILGDIVGGALYDTLVTNNNKKVQKKASGGSITRGRKRIGGRINRTLKKQKTYRRPQRITSQKTVIGKDIGGRKKVENLYGKIDPKKRSPLRALVNTSKSLKEAKSLNGLTAAMMGAGVDMSLGQKPDSSLPRQIGYTFGSIIDNSINSELTSLLGNVSRTLTMNRGGEIPNNSFRETYRKNLYRKIVDDITNSFSDSMNITSTKVFQNLKRELNLPSQNVIPGSTPNLNDPSLRQNIRVTSDSPDFWLLVTGALFENGIPNDNYQGAADVAQAIYNRVSLPGWPKSIRKVILEGDGKQFQPVRDYGTPDEWAKINSRDSAISFAKKYKGYSGNIVDRIAATLLNASNQERAKTFVGPRDSFRAEGYEKENDQLDDSTEATRYGHTFGFEPRGANIGKFKKGELKAAEINQNVIRGTVDQLENKPFTGDVSGQTFLPLPGARSIGDPSQNQQYGGKRGHQGIDITEFNTKDERAPVVAWATGKVVQRVNTYWSRGMPMGSLTIDHGNGIKTRYLHIDPKVRVNDTVYGGEKIATLVPYGNPSQTHLHFEVYKNNQIVDPTSYVKNAKNKISAPLSREKAKENYEREISPVVRNRGVVYDPKTNKFTKKGGGFFGLDQELKITDTENVQYRELPAFGLGRGSKVGEIKKAKDGKYYKWTGTKWVSYDAVGGGNASLPTSPLSQEVASISGTYTDGMLYQRHLIYIPMDTSSNNSLPLLG